MSTSINFDGVSHEVDSVIATLVAKERKAYDSQIESLEQSNESLADEKSELTSQVEKLKGELEATKTKLSELENMDSSALVADCISAWNEVLPSIKIKHPKFDADYSLSPTDIKRTYLKAVHDKEDIFDKSDDYVSGVYDGLKPNGKTSGNLAKEKAIAQFHNLDGLEAFDSDGQSAIEQARQKLIKDKENAWTTLGGK